MNDYKTNYYNKRMDAGRANHGPKFRQTEKMDGCCRQQRGAKDFLFYTDTKSNTVEGGQTDFKCVVVACTLGGISKYSSNVSIWKVCQNEDVRVVYVAVQKHVEKHTTNLTYCTIC